MSMYHHSAQINMGPSVIWTVTIKIAILVTLYIYIYIHIYNPKFALCKKSDYLIFNWLLGMFVDTIYNNGNPLYIIQTIDKNGNPLCIRQKMAFMLWFAEPRILCVPARDR